MSGAFDNKVASKSARMTAKAGKLREKAEGISSSLTAERETIKSSGKTVPAKHGASASKRIGRLSAKASRITGRVESMKTKAVNKTAWKSAKASYKATKKKGYVGIPLGKPKKGKDGSVSQPM